MKRMLDWLCRSLAAVALFAIMILTLIDVAGRKLLSESVPGSLELTELLMVVVIFAGLPLVSLAGEHVVFDSIDPWLSGAVRRVQGLLVEGACAAALAGIAWLMWIKGAQMMEYGETTAQLKLLKAPFIYGMSVLCGVTALVHLLLMASPVAHHHVGVDEAPGDGA
jgi:TRAP-type transport system small permease protein